MEKKKSSDVFGTNHPKPSRRELMVDKLKGKLDKKKEDKEDKE